MKRLKLPVALCYLCSSAFICGSASHASASPPFDPDRFEKQALVHACTDPMQIEVRPGGDVYFIERGGNLKLYDAGTGQTRLLGTVPVAVYGEVGLMGLALDPDFDAHGWVYLVYAPAATPDKVRLSRFTVTNDALDPRSERLLFEYRVDVKGNNHQGGALTFGPDRLLYMGTGDNTPPIPETPCDQREGRENFDALRTSGNSHDLRGKILRVRPRPHPEGGYDVPEGNLFPGGVDGCPEIFAMGCRNPYRHAIDPATGTLYFGDIGPNTDPRFGPEGYDEINATRVAGNFGWPMFNGPNEAFRWYDFSTQTLGEPFDAANPINASRNNPGVKKLPLPIPALIWYPSGESSDFPQLGSGGRSALAGPVYRDSPAFDAALKLPQHYDGALFIYEWTRNWIKAVRLDARGRVVAIEPFMPDHRFRKPIDMEIGPDGTMYLLEYGDKWVDNRDAQLTRIVYVRGNRTPAAAASADVTAGKPPLTVRFSARASRDKDAGDTLRYSWNLGDTASESAEPSATYDKPGVYLAELTVTDNHGASSKATLQISVGNAPPRVTFVGPPHGSFFDWGKPIAFRVEVDDEEDGSTTAGRIAADRVAIRGDYRTPRPTGQDAPPPGFALMKSSTCFACHAADQPALGPAYADVAARYCHDPTARDGLAQKVRAGGTGVWGANIMPPHPQLTIDQARQMIDWVLSLSGEAPVALRGLGGVIPTPAQPPPARGGGVYILAATFTDGGTPQAPPLTALAHLTLHARQKSPVFCDENRGVEILDLFEGGIRQVGQFSHGDHIAYKTVNLKGVSKIAVRYAAPQGRGGRLELRSGAPNGAVLTTVDLPPTGEWHNSKELTTPIHAPDGVHNLYLVAHGPTPSNDPLYNLDWVEFRGHPRPSGDREEQP